MLYCAAPVDRGGGDCLKMRILHVLITCLPLCWADIETDYVLIYFFFVVC